MILLSFFVFSAGLFSFMLMIYIHIVYHLINLILMCADLKVQADGTFRFTFQNV